MSARSASKVRAHPLRVARWCASHRARARPRTRGTSAGRSPRIRASARVPGTNDAPPQIAHDFARARSTRPRRSTSGRTRKGWGERSAKGSCRVTLSRTKRDAGAIRPGDRGPGTSPLAKGPSSRRRRRCFAEASRRFSRTLTTAAGPSGDPRRSFRIATSADATVCGSSASSLSRAMVSRAPPPAPPAWVLTAAHREQWRGRSRPRAFRRASFFSRKFFLKRFSPKARHSSHARTTRAQRRAPTEIGPH